ncbi:hypothetical protein ACLOJK_011824 [Asimina triloba]
MVDKKNTKIVNNLPYSIKDWKLRHFFIRLALPSNVAREWGLVVAIPLEKGIVSERNTLMEEEVAELEVHERGCVGMSSM